MQILDSAVRIEDLMHLPSNHFESLGGDRTGQYSIRINRRWRICFQWEEDAPCREELAEIGMTASAFAQSLHVPPNRITAILKGTRSITADTALRFSRFFGTTAEFWLNLQTAYDLRVTSQNSGEKSNRKFKRGCRSIPFHWMTMGL